MGVTRADLNMAASDAVSSVVGGMNPLLAPGGVGGNCGELGRTVDIECWDCRSDRLSLAYWPEVRYNVRKLGELTLESFRDGRDLTSGGDCPAGSLGGPIMVYSRVLAIIEPDYSMGLNLEVIPLHCDS
jgi:hypothetical protein